MRVLNKHTDHIPSDAIYIGRGSKWGNPFIIGKDGDRETVVKMYCEWILEQPKLLDDIKDLVNKDVVCFCAPRLCHGHVLKEIGNILFGGV